MTINTTVLGFSLFALGTVVGSFFNVVSFRYPKESFWGGRSRCPRCKKTLNWYELIPVFSFIVQLGRCRGCHQKISWQYPLVEILTGLAFLLPFYFCKYYAFPEHPYKNLLATLWLLIALAMILLSLIDFRRMIIPDEINIFLALAGLVFAYLGAESFLKNYLMLVPMPTNVFLNHLLGGALGLLILGVIFFVSRGRAMGMGDVKLAGAMGLILGWPDIVLALMLGFLVGGAWGAVLLILGKGKMKTLVPFGPFLVAGFWLHVFFGYHLVAWYFNLI